MYAMIFVDDTMSIECQGITSDPHEADVMWSDFLEDLKERLQGSNYALNFWNSDTEERCVEVRLGGSFWATAKMCRVG